jgi:hypothetical protein
LTCEKSLKGSASFSTKGRLSPATEARGWHGGQYPDTMPQAIKLIDAEGRSCIYVPITQDGKVVDSQGYTLDPEDD